MLSSIRTIGRSSGKLFVNPCFNVVASPKLMSINIGRVIQTNSFLTLRSPLIGTSFSSANSAVGIAPGAQVLFSSRQMSSLMKKRRSKMNKHKLRKRRKSLKMNTKQSRK